MVGYGSWGKNVPSRVKGPTFTVWVVNSKTKQAEQVYASPVLSTYDYDTCMQRGGWGKDSVSGDGCYSPPVSVDVPVKSRPKSFWVEFRMVNNDRNMVRTHHIFGVGKETAFEALVGSTPSGIY